MTHKNSKSNFEKVAIYLKKNYPDKSVGDFCDEFGYRDHIKGILTLDEETYRRVFSDSYARVCTSYSRVRMDSRSPFVTARDICANFIMEDLLASTINRTFPNITVSTNEEEERDIESMASNLPDFIYTNTDTGNTIMFDLKIDWYGVTVKSKKFFFRGNECVDYRRYGAAALIWCPNINRFAFIDFRGDVSGEYGTDETKAGKQGFWANMERCPFGEIYFGKNVFLDHMVKQLDRLSKKKTCIIA